MKLTLRWSVQMHVTAGVQKRRGKNEKKMGCRQIQTIKHPFVDCNLQKGDIQWSFPFFQPPVSFPLDWTSAEVVYRLWKWMKVNATIRSRVTEFNELLERVARTYAYLTSLVKRIRFTDDRDNGKYNERFTLWIVLRHFIIFMCVCRLHQIARCRKSTAESRHSFLSSFTCLCCM